MLNNRGFGAPKVPTPKPQSEHRQLVEDRAMDMIHQIQDGSTDAHSSPAPDLQPTQKQHTPSKLKPRSPKPKLASKTDAVTDKQYLLVPMSAASFAAFERVLASASATEKGAMRRRLIGKARDLFIAKQNIKPWSHSGEKQLTCAIRIPSGLVQEIVNRDDPAGVFAISVVIGRAFAPHLDATLAPLIQKP